MPGRVLLASACLACLVVGCDGQQSGAGGSGSPSPGARSYTELTAGRAKAIAESGEDPIREDENPRYLDLIEGLSDVEPLPSALPESFVLTQDQDTGSPVPSHYRVAAEQGSIALGLLRLDQGTLAAEQMQALNLTDMAITSAMMDQLFGPLGGDEDYLGGMARLDPIRRTYWLANSAEIEAGGYGITTFIEQYGFLVPAAAIACRTLGLKEYADALQAPIDLMPRHPNGAILWWTFPLPSDVVAACESGQRAVDGSRRNERLHFAIRHPEYFFTDSPDHFVETPPGEPASDEGKD